MDFGEWKNQNDEADLEKRLLKIRNESKKKHKLDEINQSGCLDNLLGLFIFKGSSDQSHFIFEINDGKSRIRHACRATLNLNEVIFNRFRVDLHYSISESLYVGFDSFRY